MKLLLNVLIAATLAGIFFILYKGNLKKTSENKSKEKNNEFLDNKELLDTLCKACNFSKTKGIHLNPEKTKFFSVVIDNYYQPRWISKDRTGKYYTFGAKGENFQQHPKEPLWEDFCPRTTIILYGESYYIYNDTTIISAK